MLGGNGTPDNYNAQIASSLYVRESSDKNAAVRSGHRCEMRLEKERSAIMLELQ
jgi:hypothetical protein